MQGAGGYNFSCIRRVRIEPPDPIIRLFMRGGPALIISRALWWISSLKPAHYSGIQCLYRFLAKLMNFEAHSMIKKDSIDAGWGEESGDVVVLPENHSSDWLMALLWPKAVVLIKYSGSLNYLSNNQLFKYKYPRGNGLNR
jgi:hypothetical protein